VISAHLSHIGGIPIEETAALAPALLLAFGAAGTTLRARFRVRRGYLARRFSSKNETTRRSYSSGY
jgi:hypothetical protein